MNKYKKILKLFSFFVLVFTLVSSTSFTITKARTRGEIVKVCVLSGDGSMKCFFGDEAVQIHNDLRSKRTKTNSVSEKFVHNLRSDENEVGEYSTLESNSSDIQPFLRKMHAHYVSRDPVYVGTHKGSQRIAIAEGNPGMDIWIGNIVSVSNSFNCGFSVSHGDISGTVGFNVVQSESVEVKCGYLIPEFFKGRKVSKVQLIAYPLYEDYSYTIDKILTKRGFRHIVKNVGTGMASKARGAVYEYVHYYD